jgi:hypothetical protein
MGNETRVDDGGEGGNIEAAAGKFKRARKESLYGMDCNASMGDEYNCELPPTIGRTKRQGSFVLPANCSEDESRRLAAKRLMAKFGNSVSRFKLF